MEAALDVKALRGVRSLLYFVRRKWYNIGIELSLDVEELDTIKRVHQNDPDECLVEMLKIDLA